MESRVARQNRLMLTLIRQEPRRISTPALGAQDSRHRLVLQDSHQRDDPQQSRRRLVGARDLILTQRDRRNSSLTSSAWSRAERHRRLKRCVRTRSASGQCTRRKIHYVVRLVDFCTSVMQHPDDVTAQDDAWAVASRVKMAHMENRDQRQVIRPTERIAASMFDGAGERLVAQRYNLTPASLREPVSGNSSGNSLEASRDQLTARETHNSCSRHCVKHERGY